MRTLRTVALVLLILSVLGLLAVALVVSHSYRERIFPGVSITDPTGSGILIQVGDLARAPARARVRSALGPPEARTLTLDLAEDQVWALSWADVGQSFAVEAAVEQAYAAGRDLPWMLGFLRVLNPIPVSISLGIVPADAALVRAIAEEVASATHAQPHNAELAISNGRVIPTPAQPGRRVEPGTVAAALLEALARGADRVELEPSAVAPAITDTDPALSQAEVLLAEPFVLIIYDPLTGDTEAGGYRDEIPVASQQLGAWMRVTPRNGRLHLDFDVLAVRAWMESLAPLIGEEERTLAVDETTVAVLETLRESGHRAIARIQHPPRTYVVQAGDTFYDIAFLHGFPQWRLEQVNPDIDSGLIDVGQVLSIPSIDVLFPHPLVEGKRIEIDLPTQTLTAFEDDVQVFEFTISSGISTTPTLAGQFQVLFKEELAFAQRWHLDMPYFMGFYAEGEDFYNGLHELPITSYGTRLSRHVLGWPASYGCIILDQGDAEALYHWAPVGTLVRVHGVAPGTPFGQETLLDIAPLINEPQP